MLANQRKRKALAYVDEAIEQTKNHITDCDNTLYLKTAKIYKDSMLIFKKGMSESEFEKAAEKAGYSWEMEDAYNRYEMLMRWLPNFEKTEAIRSAYEEILTVHEKTRKEIENHVFGFCEDEGVYYSDLLGMAQIGLSSDQLVEFIDAEDPMEIELGKDGNGKPFSENFRGANLISGISGSGKTVLLKNILHPLLANFLPDEMSLLLVDIGTGNEMKEFAADPHLYHGTIFNSIDPFSQFLDNELPREIEERRAQRMANKYDSIPIMLIAFNDFDAVADALGPEKAREIVKFLAWKGMENKIFSLIVSLRAFRPIFTGSMAHMRNVIAMECCSEMDSEFLLREKGAESLEKPGEMIIKNRSLGISPIIYGTKG